MKIQSVRALSIVTGLFFLAVLWFFIPVGIKFFEPIWFAMRLTLPAAILTLGSIRFHPLLIALGYGFCTFGDAMGVIGSFEGQMGGFALAQICFTIQFITETRQDYRTIPKRHTLIAAIIVAAVVCIPTFILVSETVLSAINNQTILIGCTIYSLLLLSTVGSSIIRAFVTKRYIALVGCGLFMCSDFTLAWNKFTEHIPHASFYIMTTYYAALLLIFIGTILKGSDINFTHNKFK